MTAEALSMRYGEVEALPWTSPSPAIRPAASLNGSASSTAGSGPASSPAARPAIASFCRRLVGRKPNRQSPRSTTRSARLNCTGSRAEHPVPAKARAERETSDRAQALDEERADVVDVRLHGRTRGLAVDALQRLDDRQMFVADLR